ncbi:MAG TPA: LPO_1073/Vpar_1526 family protein [Candidatus Nitrosopolaris rasttigaisensis]|nr:LPO_1073/Vpar_1526 family protein [Candidatus Nitrosopolaris rasttigaisensis]
MINSTNQNQASGDNSTNIQAKSVTIHGITYEDARSIALDVFKSNYLILSENAAEIARKRAEELIDAFLNKLQEKIPEAIKSVETPSMQHAIFSAQKEYAKTGDKELCDSLIDILIERAKEEDRNLKQIVLDECISVLPKLTLKQLDTLSIIFSFKYSKYNSVVNFESLKRIFELTLRPFVISLSNENSVYQHLEYVGCGTISLASLSLEQSILENYRRIFSSGFSKEEFETYHLKNLEKYNSLIIPCLNNSSIFQINADSSTELLELGKINGLNEHDVSPLIPLINNYSMNVHEVKEKLLTMGDFMGSIMDFWTNSNLKNMTLTTVGIALALMNSRRKIGTTADLSIWIK